MTNNAIQKDKLCEHPSVDVHTKNITSILDILQVNKKFPLSDDIKVNLKNKIKFYRVTLAATFEPPVNVRIKYGKVSVSTNETKSMVHSVSPDIKVDIINVKKNLALNTSLKLQSFGVEIGPGFSYIDDRTYDIIHPQIVGTYRKQNASWQFNTTNSRNYIHGTQELEFIVKQPSNIVSGWTAEIMAKISPAKPFDRLMGRIRDEKIEAKKHSERFKVPSKE